MRSDTVEEQLGKLSSPSFFVHEEGLYCELYNEERSSGRICRMMLCVENL